MIVYVVESFEKRAEVQDAPLGYFRVLFGQNGEWNDTYRVTDSLDKAKTFADEWVAGK